MATSAVISSEACGNLGKRSSALPYAVSDNLGYLVVFFAVGFLVVVFLVVAFVVVFLAVVLVAVFAVAVFFAVVDLLAGFLVVPVVSCMPAALAIWCNLALRRLAVFGFNKSFFTALSYSD